MSEEISRACLENSRIHKSRGGCLDSSLSVHVSSHARAHARASLTVSCLARPAGASAAVAAVASVVSTAVSCVRSYAEVASAACDDAVALHDVPCVLVIQVVLVASCLCRGPPVTAWIIRGRTRLGYRVPRAQGGSKVPAEDLRPVSEVEAGVNFRPVGGVQGQVAGSLPRRQPGTGTRQVKGSVVTPSLHTEVPGIQFVSPRYGLDIRQSMGWTKVCGTAQSGIWVLKGNARTRMSPANLDHLRVGWRKQGSYETAWVTPGHDCIRVWTWSSSQTTNQ